MNGNAITEYASLSGKIHTLVIDKTLKIGGAAADAKATGEKINAIRSGYENIDTRVEDAENAALRAEKSAKLAEDIVKNTYRRDQILTQETAMSFGQDMPDYTPDAVFQTIDRRYERSTAKIYVGSYVGTGVEGAEGIVELSFAYPPKILALFSDKGIMLCGSDTETPAIGFPQALTTDFGNGLFVSDYGSYHRRALRAKRSEDGLTISWRHEGYFYDEEYDSYTYSASAAFNSRGVTYNYVAIC